MRVVVAGGTGFLGDALAAACIEGGDEVVVLTRTPGASRKGVSFAVWDPSGDPAAWAPTLDGADVLVNLAGASIAGGRWTNRRKVLIWDSRLNATRALAKAMTMVDRPPGRVITGSAIGYYGSRGDETLTEESAAGSDFLARLCVAWEAAGRMMSTDLTSVASIRTGLVLAAHDGALPRMALPFKVGAGGVVGDGTQFMSWIHLDDWVAMVRRLMTTADSGAWNLTAPLPVTNANFTTTLAQVLHRPALVPAPAFAVRLALGEMADALLLASQRVEPARALADGHTFRYPTLETALRAVYPGRRQVSSH